MSQRLEMLVGVRDSLDERDGRPHGPANRVEIRSTLALATAPLLTRGTTYDDRSAVRRQFSLGEVLSDDDFTAAAIHTEEMQRISEG